MEKMSWVAAAIACVLVAGAFSRAHERVQNDRREAVEDGLRVGAALARAYEEGIATHLDLLRASGREEELAQAIASAKVGVAVAAPGASHIVQVVAADERRNLRQDGYLYSFRTLVRHPLTVVVGMAESTVIAAAERRRSDHYMVAVLESILAVIATAAMARFAWHGVARARRLQPSLAGGRQ